MRLQTCSQLDVVDQIILTADEESLMSAKRNVMASSVINV